MKRTPLRRRTPLRTRRVRPGWWQVRKFVAGRADGRCEARTAACMGRGAHAHHIKMRSAGGDDAPGNLLWVCPPCHVYIHTHPAESHERGWLRRAAA